MRVALQQMFNVIVSECSDAKSTVHPIALLDEALDGIVLVAASAQLSIPVVNPGLFRNCTSSGSGLLSLSGHLEAIKVHLLAHR